jgi:hypothetical protein
MSTVSLATHPQVSLPTGQRPLARNPLSPSCDVLTVAWLGER